MPNMPQSSHYIIYLTGVRRIENELIPMCQKLCINGLGIISWSPTAQGVLADRYSGSFYADRVTEPGIQVGVEFAKIAKKTGVTPIQLAILWCKTNRGPQQLSWDRAPLNRLNIYRPFSTWNWTMKHERHAMNWFLPEAWWQIFTTPQPG